MTASIIASLFGIAKHALGIYATKQAREYLDRVVYLEKVYYAEENKQEHLRNHALMDNAINELCIIVDATARFKV
jgi:hypothetical protein